MTTIRKRRIKTMSGQVFKMNLNPQPFEQIRSGRKTVELRLYDEKRRKIGIGDEIEFSCEGQSVTAEVIALHRADSFKELFGKIAPESAGFDSAEDYTLMRNYYSEEEEKAFGVIGIEIRIIL